MQRHAHDYRNKFTAILNDTLLRTGASGFIGLCAFSLGVHDVSADIEALTG